MMGNDRKPDFCSLRGRLQLVPSPAGGGRLTERSSALITSLVSVLLQSSMLVDRFDSIIDTD